MEKLMDPKGILPEDVLAEDENYTVIKGIRVRKGTIAAVLQNAAILASNQKSPAEKAVAKNTITELAPALVVLGMHEHIIWKNSEIQEIVERAAIAINKNL